MLNQTDQTLVPTPEVLSINRLTMQANKDTMQNTNEGWKPIKDAPRDGTVIEIKGQEPPGKYRYSNGRWEVGRNGFQTAVTPMRSGLPLEDKDHLMWR